ncbi:hypothetical protein Gotri_006603 [Gossypium trilobum]|uniref:Uncharacterized protein n=1 Tax=Gossypium trilobum TaxID=34281 RepID=A0A7J9F0F4_9ROSI|nr:hypothetical protein [Gossypium trilobum]
MSFEKENLDLILVPAGLLIMFAYHLFLLYRYIHRPHTTVIGFENTDKEAWVERVLQVMITPFLNSINASFIIVGLRYRRSALKIYNMADKEAISNALTVIASNTSAATFLCSVCLTLSSLIGSELSFSIIMVFILYYLDTNTKPPHHHQNLNTYKKLLQQAIIMV